MRVDRNNLARDWLLKRGDSRAVPIAVMGVTGTKYSSAIQGWTSDTVWQTIESIV